MSFVIPKKKGLDELNAEIVDEKGDVPAEIVDEKGDVPAEIVDEKGDVPAESSPRSGDNAKQTKRKANRKPKAAKDANAPKRPASAFMLYASANRAAILSELGNLTVPELGKEMGRRWSALDAAAKLPFQQQAEAAKEKYKLELSSYTPSPEVSAAQKMTKKQKKATKDPGAPKKPCSSFLFWAKQERETVRAELASAAASSGEDEGVAATAISVAAVGKELGRRWNILSAEAKKEFEEKAMAAKQQYQEALSAYTPPKVETLPKQQKNTLPADKTKTVKRAPGAPKRPRSAFLLWATANRDQVRSEMVRERSSGDGSGNNQPSGAEVQKELARRWGEQATDVRTEYEAKSRHEVEKYKEAIIEFNRQNKSIAAGPSSAGEEKENNSDAEKKHSGPASQIWAREHREAVRAELGGKVTSAELNKELAKRWKALDKITKASYKGKRRTEDQKEGAALSTPKKAKPDKDSLAESFVTRPRDAFYFFILEISPSIRAENVDKLNHRQVLEIAKQRWAALPADKRELFKQMAVQDIKRHQREVNAFEQAEKKAAKLSMK